MNEDYQMHEYKGARYFTVKRFEAFSSLINGFGGKPGKADLFFEALGMNPENVLSLKQVHSDRILSVRDKSFCLDSLKGREGDAIVTDLAGLPLAVRTADCLPIVLFHPDKRVIAVVHAGRKGTLLQIAGKAVEKIKRDYDISSETLLAALGPSIKACCYEIGDEIVSEVMKKYDRGGRYIKKTMNNKYFLDLTAMNIDQLTEGGLKRENIISVGLCTCCRPDLFFSYRRDNREKGRMMNAAMLVSD
jgi:YfiH family protein